jgi:hypothetical protein
MDPGQPVAKGERIQPDVLEQVIITIAKAVDSAPKLKPLLSTAPQTDGTDRAKYRLKLHGRPQFRLF